MLHKADAGKAMASTPPVRTSNSGLALGILAVFAIVIGLYMARAFVVPLLIGILTSYALYPVVDWLTVRRIPRPISAALVLVVLGGGLLWVGYLLSDDVAVMMEKLPEAARQLREHILDGSSSPTPLQNVQEAARELAKAAATAAGKKVPARIAEAVPTPAGNPKVATVSHAGDPCFPAIIPDGETTRAATELSAHSTNDLSDAHH